MAKSNGNAGLSGAEKERYVRGMFSRISRRYDLMNSLMSFGQDAMWRRYTARLAAPSPGALALDVATGTGLIAQELARRGARAVAVDFTPAMMVEGRERGVGRGEPVAFVAGDALALPFATGTFDAVTTGFAMRNVTDIVGAFREMWRVLKPGGRVVCLEVGRPVGRIQRAFHRTYTGAIIPIVGGLITGEPDAYSYLPRSMQRFPPPEELAEIMRMAGFRRVGFRQLTFGAAAIHKGLK